MAEHSILGPRFVRRRAAFALIMVILLPCLCAAWLNGWQLFSFPLGTFLVWLGVPVGLIAVAMIVPRVEEDEEVLDP